MYFQDSERWLASLQKSIRAQSPNPLSLEDIQDKLREAVKAHTYNITQALTESDYANLGVISKQDFQNVMNKSICRLTDDQVMLLYPRKLCLWWVYCFHVVCLSVRLSVVYYFHVVRPSVSLSVRSSVRLSMRPCVRP